MSALLLLSSCGTYTESGAYMGATFGEFIGSAIGGISGGWKGEHVGSLIGMVGGAAVGAAIGQAVEEGQQKKYEEYAKQREIRRSRTDQGQANRKRDDSGFDPTNSHDDRITFDDSPASVSAALDIRNARFVDADGDGILKRGEKCTVSFEIMNHSDLPVYNIQPLVTDVTANKHVNISPNLLIESINPRQGVRYSATVLADNRLKDGQIVVRIGVAAGQTELTSLTREFKIVTRKK